MQTMWFGIIEIELELPQRKKPRMDRIRFIAGNN
jgi:hypothetical protein